jgi:hypothetical protein
MKNLKILTFALYYKVCSYKTQQCLCFVFTLLFEFDKNLVPYLACILFRKKSTSYILFNVSVFFLCLYSHHTSHISSRISIAVLHVNASLFPESRHRGQDCEVLLHKGNAPCLHQLQTL